eukprot:752452-Hanusia_phi.AAC.1
MAADRLPGEGGSDDFRSSYFTLLPVPAFFFSSAACPPSLPFCPAQCSFSLQRSLSPSFSTLSQLCWGLHWCHSLCASCRAEVMRFDGLSLSASSS